MTDENAKTSSNAKVLGGCMVLLVIFGSCWYIVGSSSDSPERAAERKREDANLRAYVMCQQFVEDKLVAPSTAKFPGLAGGDVRVSGGEDGRWSVRSHVDAQNSFGAMIRTPFTCEVSTTDGNNFTLQRLDI